jgi:ABC-type lipoprotein export system ATPase subunit
VNRPPLSPEAQRLLAAGFGRRRFLAGLGAGSLALAAGGALTACGTGPVGTGAATDSAAEDRSDTDKSLVVSNWQLYIDIDEDDTNLRPTLAAFEENTGVSVEYLEDITDNESFYAKISPQLRAGQDIGRDLIVPTDWLVARLIRQGYLQPIDKGNTPNFPANLIESLQSPSLREAGRCCGRTTWSSPTRPSTRRTPSCGSTTTTTPPASSRRGSFFALLGPSGCGKTNQVTLRMQTIRRDSRREQDHHPARRAADPSSATPTSPGTKPYKRPVNTVFQSYALFPHLDIFENVAFGLRRRGQVKQSSTSTADAGPTRSRRCSSSWSGASTMATNPARPKLRQMQLESGGQQQREATGPVALINQARIERAAARRAADHLRRFLDLQAATRRCSRAQA